MPLKYNREIKENLSLDKLKEIHYNSVAVRAS